MSAYDPGFEFYVFYQYFFKSELFEKRNEFFQFFIKVLYPINPHHFGDSSQIVNEVPQFRKGFLIFLIFPYLFRDIDTVQLGKIEVGSLIVTDYGRVKPN
jgi:hypothetical protein